MFAALLVFSLVLTVVDGKCTDALCEKEWTSLAYKKESDNQCYIHQYVINLNQEDGKDPLRNYVPLNSYLIDCVDGYDVIGMNAVKSEDKKNTKDYFLMVCFYLEKNDHEFVCHILKEGVHFVKLFSGICHGKNKTLPFFRIKCYPESFKYMVGFTGCQLVFYYDEKRVVLSQPIINCQTEAISGEDICYPSATNIFPFGHYFIFCDDKKHLRVREDEGSLTDPIEMKNSYQFIFINRQNYDDEDVAVFVPDSPVSILGLKYFEDPLNSSNCMVIAENRTRDKSVYMAGVPCHANRLASGFNIEWDVDNQTAYIRACFVYRTNGTVKLQCHLPNNKGWKTDVDFDFVECQDHLANEAIMSVTVGDLQRPTDEYNYVLISTETKTCKVTADISEKSFTEALEEVLPSSSFDPVLVEKIRFADLDDDLKKKLGKQIFHWFNGNTFARISATEWIIDWRTKTDSTVNGKTGGKYDYLIEEIHIVTLKLMTKGTKNAKPPRQIMTWSCTVYDNVQPGESCLDVKRRRNAAPQPVGAAVLVFVAVLIQQLLG